MTRCLAWLTLMASLMAPAAQAAVPTRPDRAAMRAELAQATPPAWDLVDFAIETQADLRAGNPPVVRTRYAATYRLRADGFRVIASDDAAAVVEPVALAGEVRVVRGLATSTLAGGDWSTDFPSPAAQLGSVGLPRDDLPQPPVLRGSEAAAGFWRRQAERVIGRATAAAQEAVLADAVRRGLDAELPDFLEVRALETVEGTATERRLRAEVVTTAPTFSADARDGTQVFLLPAAPAGQALTLSLRVFAEPGAPERLRLVVEDTAALDALGRPATAFAATPIVRGSPEEQAHLARREAERARAVEAELDELRRQVESLNRRQRELEEAPPVVQREYVDRFIFVPRFERPRPELPPPTRLPRP